jgi:Tfp pilus assembly protein FimT
MTLLEILLTLCLLVILASLTWPALGRPMATQRLRAAVDQVRTEWVHARVKAMSSGQPHTFRYTLDGDSYLLEAEANEDDVSETTSANPTNTAGQDSGDSADSRSQHHRLPDKIRFITGQAAGQSGTQSAASGVQSTAFGSQSPAASAASSAAGDSASLSQPIFFYADGTSSDAQVSLRNEYGQTVALSLRGLTGVVLVSEVRSAEAGGQ